MQKSMDLCAVNRGNLMPGCAFSKIPANHSGVHPACSKQDGPLSHTCVALCRYVYSQPGNNKVDPQKAASTN